jgi:class 3 adenylate cyclase
MQLTLKEATDYLRLVIENYGSMPYKNYALTKGIAFFPKGLSATELVRNQIVADMGFRRMPLPISIHNCFKSAGNLGELILLAQLYQLALSYQTNTKRVNSTLLGLDVIENENALAVERAHSQATDEILANILPQHITERLIKGEKKIADVYENVSVLFVDIVGFTELSTTISPSELIDILDIVFTRFDTICKKHGLEKIKTIGDAYMAVCGAPVAYTNHAERTALSALEMMDEFSIEMKFADTLNLIFRIGLHSGSVVAGIIGENKYAYDLWGDTVNTASRMESYGESGKIHVSEEFVRAIGANNSTFHFTPRGELLIKGKGKMNTYFLERLSP